LSALQLEEGTRKGIALVVDSQGAARRREVEVGDAQGEKRVVLTGLKAGETVVIEGGYELPDGTPVRSGKEPGK
jgi:membrane fusion protein (multidrug efflux system)